MKNFTRILALFLCVVLLAFAFASCGRKKNTDATEATTATAKNPDDSGKSTTSTTPATTTVNVWPSIAEEVGAFSAANRKFLIELDNHSDAERNAANVKYLQGPDAIEEGVTSAIEQLIYERNEAAKELLGIEIEYTTWDYGWDAQTSQIQTVVEGNAADAPDLFVNMVFDLNNAIKLSGVFLDVWSISNSYFDFDAKGWMKSWMESYSFTGDRAYVLGSDYFLDMLRAMGVLPFNLDLMDQNSAKLATVILPQGETLSEGEGISAHFFDFVEEGKWTWDALGKISEAIWVDTDGNQASSIGDLLGIATDRYSGMPSALIIFSTGEELTETRIIEDPADPNNGKQWIYLKEDTDAVNAIFDAVKSVMTGPGAFVTAGGASGSTIDSPGIAYLQTKFAEDTLLFAGPTLLGALEMDVFQQMQSTYSVVPMPKVDINKDYNTIVHNTADCGAINVHTVPEKARAISAFLQYCTVNSGEIREEFLQIVAKYKMTTYDQGTDRMLDLIYDKLANSRDKAVEDASMRKSGERFHGKMKDNEFAWGSAEVAAWYESARASKQAKIDELLTNWYERPKVESAPAAE